MRACLFNIQKFSIHDGPGIRTTVFFKGCPLRCFWCSNPESLAAAPQLMWSARQCRGCGVCAGVCPEGALRLEAGAVRVDYGRCRACGECVAACPAEALAVSGKEYSLDEALAACLRDKDFYDESGGGVTLSGGEAAMQADFAAALLRRLRDNGVHTALETNGCAAPAIFQAVAGEADLLLFDVKHYDEAKHRAGTGAGMETILANLRWALASGKEVIARIPVIRGYNDSPEDARGFGRLLSGLGLGRARLLPFHQMGQGKYSMLGMEYLLDGLAPLHAEDLEEYRRIMQDAGIAEALF